MSQTANDARPVIVTREEATAIGGFGDVFTTLRSDDTSGRFAVVDFTLEPDSHGPPLHVHETFDEIYHVVEGTILVTMGAERRHAPAGSSVFIPRGVAHTVVNDGGRPARFLFMMSPGGFERSFDELSAVIDEHGDASPEDFARIMRNYDVTIVHND